MMMFANFLGRLSWDALPDNPITIGGAISMPVIGIAIVTLLTVTKRWKWLLREWLTTVDPKKIGIMYLIVAMVMLLRGFADVLIMRAQQALSSGDSKGFISPDMFQQV